MSVKSHCGGYLPSCEAANTSQYGHQKDGSKCPHYSVVGIKCMKVGIACIFVSSGPSELSVIERCPY